jgi:tetratricopeptide (TPR) repeat protein
LALRPHASSSGAASCASAEDTPVDRPLSNLGRFRIRRLLGRGGYGIVYLAFDPLLGRDVALKVPRARVLADPELRARFRHEARAAAGLDHPNIVPVFEAGEADSVFYIASAYCPGLTLARWLSQRSEPLPGRVAASLLSTLAEAVHHAHSRGVLHRDLKPSNLLLQKKSREPRTKSQDERSASDLELDICDFEPKVMDFGLAKLLSGPEVVSDSEGHTPSGEIVGTPSYMAPEQAEGKVREISTAADVYALGAILYELLTGRPPFQAETVLATLEQVRSQEPVPPRRLQPCVAPDLEIICLKCLAKAPRQRYPSAHGLADDLGRFLAGQPIQARPVGARERIVKWARRKPALAGLVSLGCLAVVGLPLAGVWHTLRVHAERDMAVANSQRADANFEKACEAVDRMLTEVGHVQLVHVPHLEPVRRKLLQEALAFYQGFLRENATDPGLRRETGRAFDRIGYIHQLMGEFGEAERAYRQAVGFHEQLAADFPDELAHRKDLADCCNSLASVLRNVGRTEEAEQAYRRALALREALVADFSNVPDFRATLAISHHHLGELLRIINRLHEAEHHYGRAVTLRQELVAEFPDEPARREALANTYGGRGALFQESHQLREAAEAYHKAQDHQEKLVAAFPNNPEYRWALASTNHNRSELLRTAGRSQDAEQASRHAVALAERVAADFPHVLQYRRGLATMLNRRGAVLRTAGHPQEAERAYERALTLGEQLAVDFPEVPDCRCELGITFNNLANLLAVRGELRESRRRLEQAIVHHQAAVKQNPRHPIYRQHLRGSYGNLAEALILLGDHEAAAEVAGELHGVKPESGESCHRAAGILAGCAAIVDNDSTLPHDKKSEISQRYRDQALTLLESAVQTGYTDDTRLTQDKDLDPLRAHAEFQSLLRRSEAKAKAVAR